MRTRFHFEQKQRTQLRWRSSIEWTLSPHVYPRWDQWRGRQFHRRPVLAGEGKSGEQRRLQQPLAASTSPSSSAFRRGQVESFSGVFCSLRRRFCHLKA